MSVRLDDFGSETTFYILDVEGYIIEEYGPFQDSQNGRVITESIALPRGVYTFLLEDSFGDGICCQYGRGNWRLFIDGTPVVASNGRFGYWEAYDFAVGAAKLEGPIHTIDPKLPKPLKTKELKR